MVYFVAFNPFRDHWPRDGNSRAGESLEIVKRAINEHGAFGVKVYPPSGYRPAGNEIPGPPVGPDTRFDAPREQYKARYDGVTKEQLDQRLERLLKYCTEHDIPVFAHSGDGEFQARNGYGVQMPNPRYWLQYLENHNEPDGSPCKLRLCFAHAGAGDFWFGVRYPDSHETWGDDVVKACEKFPNVYCELGATEQILDVNRRAYFVDQLVEQIGKHPKLADKLMFGTDWCMPSALYAGKEYLRAYQNALAHKDLKDHFKKFFVLNAVKYLNIERRINDPTPGDADSPPALPPVVKTRLENFLKSVPK
jgi:predicted TIM-barrel fold metal-dependent hydrolase